MGWAEAGRRNNLQNNLHGKVPYDDESNVTDWTAACILELSKMTVCTRVDGTGPGDAFAVPELLTGLATADTDDLVSGLVSSLVRRSGSQFWMRRSPPRAAAGA